MCNCNKHSAIQKIAKFGKAVKQTALEGMPSSDVIMARLARCRECPRLAVGGLCKECGCQTDLKARLKPNSCPKGYWES